MKHRIISLVLAVLFVCSMAACGNNTKPMPSNSDAASISQESSAIESAPATQPEETAPSAAESSVEAADSIFPLVEDGSVTLSVWQTLNRNVMQYLDTEANNQNYLWDAIEELTGLNLDFLYVSDDVGAETFQLMISSGDFRDIIIGGRNSYSAGPDAAIDDGVFVDLAEYKDLMPHYMKWVEQDDISKKTAYSDFGRIAYFCQVYDRTEGQFLGYGIRQDWLDDLSLDMPETIDDWTNVLTAFKEEKTTDGAAPLELQSSGIPDSSFFIGAYGCRANTLADFYIQKDGKVFYSPATEGFRGYLETMAKWYADGLLDPDFVTNGGFGFEPQMDRVGSNKSGAAQIQFTMAGTYFADNDLAEENAYFSLAPRPKLHEDDELLVSFANSTNMTTGGTAVAASCKYPEYAIQMLDYLYSEEGSFLANYGIEGVTFEYVDGEPRLTDLITNDPVLNTDDAQQKYLLHNGPLLIMLDRVQAPYFGTEGIRYNDIWGGVGKYNIMGALTFSAEEGSERADILNNANTYVSEFLLRAITGEIELDDASWTRYMTDLENMNLARADEITQSAYDRMQSR